MEPPFLLQVHGRAHFFEFLWRPLCATTVPPEIAIRAPMNNDRSSGGSSDGTTPPRSVGTDHEVDPPPHSPTFDFFYRAYSMLAYAGCGSVLGAPVT